MREFQSSTSLEVLQTRAGLLQRARTYFDSHGFMEVQTPVLSADTVVDRHLDPISVTVPRDPCRPSVGPLMFLQTSPEFALKRLLASGAKAIYEITPAFRVGELGRLHNPEFTMLEWYRCGDSMTEAITFLSDLIVKLLDRQTATAHSVSEAFAIHAEFDPLTTRAADILARCHAAHVAVPESMDDRDWDACFDLAFTELVQPKLGWSAPDIIYDYPASQAALARIRNSAPPVAERFELFVDGVELANGYHELLDADEFERRNEQANQQRVAAGKPALPVRSRLLSAMRSGLPQCSGVALGFDRLVMLAVGADRISDVLCFPFDRA
jgi:lysyl-tRNA synthetase class 2